MPYLTKKDDISVLPLSVRSKKCLRSANIYTIEAMMEYPEDEFINIRNMGKKSVDEIHSFILSLRKGSSEFVLVDDEDSLSGDKVTCSEKGNCVVTSFVDGSGSIVQDIPINDLSLSVRAKKCLTNNGYNFVSQLVGITRTMLTNLPNMSKKTAEEVLLCMEKVSIQHRPGDLTVGISSFNDELVGEMCVAYGENESIWLSELLNIKKQFPEAMGETFVYRIYDSVFVRGTVKAKIMQIIEENGGELSMATLKAYLPQHLNNVTVLEEILLELESTFAIRLGEVMIYRQYPSIVQYVAQLQNNSIKEMLQARLNGKTLQEIGDQYSITRERVRQITQRELKKKPYLREDKYKYIYDNYNFSIEDFTLAFDEPIEIYNYLDIICQVKTGKKKPLEEILTDTTIAPEYRKKAERAIYKQYIFTDGVHVKKTRPELVKHYIKTNCKNLTKFENFISEYDLWLDVLGLSGNPSLALNSRTYENILNKCNYVLWNQWRSFRYYNIPERDFEELLSALNIEQFEDTELSTLKLFKDNRDLMQQYDIRDEYELHNLLKKIWTAENNDVKFKKMPTIEVGNANPSNQVLSLLLQYAPVTAEDLANHYEDVYGVKAATVMSNYLQGIERYYYQGVYSVDFAALPDTQFNRMKTILERDFYTIQEVKRLYKREFPDYDGSLINSYTLKMLDFRVYSSYVVKNIFASAFDYFRSLLTVDDIVDARNMSKFIQNNNTYYSVMHRLRAEYEIIEFLPLQYVNIRRLNAAGITVDDLTDYQKAVARNYERGEYFTITSLRQDGFINEIDELGFDEWFYSSLLLEDRKSFSYQRIGGTRIFLRGKTGANMGDMLVWILEKYQRIDFYDLLELLESRYGIKLPKDKLFAIIDGTDLYYDSIMEAVYIDYNTYFEEI